MTQKIIAFLSLVMLSMGSVVAQNAKGIQLKSDIDTLSYALGSDFGLSLHKITNTLEDEIDFDLFFKGVNDYLGGESVLDHYEVRDFLHHYINVVNPQKALNNAEAYLEDIAQQEGVQRTSSGLLYEIVIRGNMNKRAKLDTDLVRINYEGKLRNGTVFDSSFERNESKQEALNQLIKGLAEGVKLIGEGGVIKLWIPPHLGYGRHGIYGGIVGPNQVLVYTITLIGVTPTPEPEPEPEPEVVVSEQTDQQEVVVEATEGHADAAAEEVAEEVATEQEQEQEANQQATTTTEEVVAPQSVEAGDGDAE